jgi:methyltransferase (TIGR00027 family)
MSSGYIASMRDGSPSATARAVAQVRATMDRPVTAEGDGEIERQLVERFPSDRRSPMADLLERRTQWFDSVTLQAVEGGIRQVVIVAAGYDCRALRFRTSGVRFTELDHPDTQADKRRILDDMRADMADVAFAAADFTIDDVGAALAAAGHDADAATLFLVEGLLIYLPEPVIVSLLTALRARATPTSQLAVSISRGGSPEFQARVAAVGEHARSSFNEDEARLLLQRCGWQGDTARSVVLASPA